MGAFGRSRARAKAVTVPAELAPDVLAAFSSYVLTRARAEGAQPSEQCRRLLADLYAAAHPPPGASGSADGTCDHEPDTVEIGVTETARSMGASREYVRRLCRTGAIPARRVGRTWLVTVERKNL